MQRNSYGGLWDRRAGAAATSTLVENIFMSGGYDHFQDFNDVWWSTDLGGIFSPFICHSYLVLRLKLIVQHSLLVYQNRVGQCPMVPTGLSYYGALSEHLDDARLRRGRS